MGEGEEAGEAMNPPPWLSEPWWRWFITIALAGLVTGLVFFLANWWINVKARRAAEKERRATEREQRINGVVDAYVRVATTHPIQHQGVAALFISGVQRLHDHEEIQEALERSAERVGTHPLGRDATRIDKLALREFFQAIKFDGGNVTGYKEALAKYSAKSE